MPRISAGFITNAAYVTGGFIGIKMAYGMVAPMLPPMFAQPMLRIVAKGATAWGLGWLGGMVVGKSNGNLLMVGGFVEVINDAFQTFVAPMMPGLALPGNAVGVYPELGVYPQLGNGYDYSNPYAVGVGAEKEFDE